MLSASGAGDSESNNGASPESNGEDGAGALQVAAAGQGGTKATQKQKAAQPQKGQQQQKAPPPAVGSGNQTVSQQGDYELIAKEEFDDLVYGYTPIVQDHGSGSLVDAKNPFKFTRPVTDYKGRVIDPGALNIAVANTYAELTDPGRAKKDPNIPREARVTGASGISKVPIVTTITEDGVASEALAIAGTYFNRLDEIQRPDVPEYVKSKYGTIDDDTVPSSVSEIILAIGHSRQGSSIQFAPPNDMDKKYLNALTRTGDINMGIYEMAVVAVMATALEGPRYDFDSFRGIEQGSRNRDFRPGEINLGAGNDFRPMKPYVKPDKK